MLIKEKILLIIPILYSELIYDHLKDNCRSRTEFIIKAIEEKFERDNISYIPKSFETYENIEDIPLEKKES